MQLRGEPTVSQMWIDDPERTKAEIEIKLMVARSRIYNTDHKLKCLQEALK